jgi:hypothetical protein
MRAKVKEAVVLQHHLLPKTAGRERSKVRIAVDSEQELALEIQVAAERNAPGGASVPRRQGPRTAGC